LNIIVIRRWSHWRPGALQDQTTFGQRPVLRTVEFVASILRGTLGLPFAAGRSQWRNPAVAWIDHERRAPRFDDLRSAVPPEIVIGTTDVGLGRTVTAVLIIALNDILFVVRRFFVGKEFFAGQIGGTFQGRERGKAPCTLQIRMTVRRALRRR